MVGRTTLRSRRGREAHPEALEGLRSLPRGLDRVGSPSRKSKGVGRPPRSFGMGWEAHTVAWVE